MIPCSEALKMNWICFQNVSFDLLCNKLEEWLIKENYNPTVVKNQILKSRIFPKDTLLGWVKEVKNIDRFGLSFTNHPSIKNFQNNEQHILLTPKKEYRKYFGHNRPMIGWRKPKSLKDCLFSAKFKCEWSSVNKSVPCYRPRCQICPFLEGLNTF